MPVVAVKAAMVVVGMGEALRARPTCGSLRSVRPLCGRTGTYVPPPVLLSQHLLHKGMLRNPFAAGPVLRLPLFEGGRLKGNLALTEARPLHLQSRYLSLRLAGAAGALAPRCLKT